jgi:hypothetical protein
MRSRGAALAALVIVVLVAGWTLPNPVGPCGRWRWDVQRLVSDWSKLGHELSFDPETEMDEADAYLDDLLARAESLGRTRPPLCPQPGAVMDLWAEGSGLPIPLGMLVPED